MRRVVVALRGRVFELAMVGHRTSPALARAADLA
jgi:hypothetical protein